MAAPAAPSGLVAHPLTGSIINLSWVDNSSNELNFELERSPNGITGWTLIASPLANATTYANTGLAQNTTYFYRIRAVNADGNSAYSNIASALTLLPGRAPITPRMYLHIPRVVFAAQVNAPTPYEYPIGFVAFDNVTTGAYTDIRPGMTLLLGTTPGADNLGRQRVRADATATQIFVGRSSFGHHDGELMAHNNMFLTVLDERRVWAKLPYIDSAGESFKDGVLPVEWRTTEPPPVAVMGAGFAGTTNATTGVIVVLFNGQNSYAVADGATIVSFLWNIGDGTLIAGTLTSDNITATFEAGFRYVSLTVTDSNGHSHTTERPIFAEDADDRQSFDAFQITSHRITEQGQTLTVAILADMPRVIYPDGTLCMIWEFEQEGAAERSHMLIIGWLDTENNSMGAGRNGLTRDTTLTILDVAARLDMLPGLPQSIADDLSRIVEKIPNITWAYMVAPNLLKYIHYLLLWHSTALEVADFVMPDDAAAFPFTLLSSDGDSLWNQVDRRARAFVPDRVLTCDRAGVIRIVPDPMLADYADRTAIIQAAIDENEWSDIRYTYQRSPRTHWLRAGAILAMAWADLPLDVNGNKYIPTVFSIAPGDTPGQGLGEMVQGEQLALSQDALNAASGHRYTRANAPLGMLVVTLLQDDGAPGSDAPWREIEPAWKEWVTLTVSAETAARRRLTFTAARFLPKEVNIRYAQTKSGLARTVELTLELETVGAPGKTVIKPVDVPAVGEQPPPPPPWVPPLPGDPAIYYGNIAAYICWDNNEIARTWNLQASTPVWAKLFSTFSGTIYDCQYMHVDANTVGMWVMTSEGIFFCPDIMAATPVVNSVLTITTVRATAVAPTTGNVIFASMAHYWLQPGHLCVAMSLDTENDNYLHCYYWVTEDYGVNWTPVDVTAYTFSSSGLTRCYYVAGRYSMAAFRSEPTLWCGRSNGQGAGDGAVFRSDDGGHTWTKQYPFDPVRHSNAPAILHPYPSMSDRSYAVVTQGSGTTVGRLLVSTDGWATATQLAEPAGHSGFFGVANQNQRPNKNPFDAQHIIALFKIDGSSNADLYESDDGGATWTLLANLNNSTVTPNGWPPDVNQWVLIDNTDNPRVRLTLDNFATVSSRQGNLTSVLTLGNGNVSGGFALPKVGPNT